MIFFNFLGLGFVVLGFAAGAVSNVVLHGNPMQLVLGALVAGGLDFYVRSSQGEQHWFHFRAGGHVMFIPVWIWGVLMVFCGLLGVIATAASRHH